MGSSVSAQNTSSSLSTDKNVSKCGSMGQPISTTPNFLSFTQVTDIPDVLILKNILSSKIPSGRHGEAWVKQNREMISDFCGAAVHFLRSSDPLFTELYVRLSTKASYDRLSLCGTNEFRVDMVLELPVNSISREIVPDAGQAGLACCKMCDNWKTVSYNNLRKYMVCNKIEEFFLVGDYLTSSKVQRWMQCILNKTEFWKHGFKHVHQISITGDSQTKVFNLHSVFQGVPYEVSVYFVPVIQLPLSEISSDFDTPRLRRLRASDCSPSCHMVPAECDQIYRNKHTACAKSHWRLYILGFERFVILDAGCAKWIVKLLKILWEKQDWHELPSSALQTVVLSIICENPSPRYWDEANMALRLIEALEKLSKCLCESQLLSIVFEDNLLYNIDPTSLSAINSKLQQIISDLEKDFTKNINKYF